MMMRNRKSTSARLFVHLEPTCNPAIPTLPPDNFAALFRKHASGGAPGRTLAAGARRQLGQNVRSPSCIPPLKLRWCVRWPRCARCPESEGRGKSPHGTPIASEPARHESLSAAISGTMRLWCRGMPSDAGRYVRLVKDRRMYGGIATGAHRPRSQTSEPEGARVVELTDDECAVSVRGV